jgi:hypothetical protein
MDAQESEEEASPSLKVILIFQKVILIFQHAQPQSRCPADNVSTVRRLRRP